MNAAKPEPVLASHPEGEVAVALRDFGVWQLPGLRHLLGATPRVMPLPRRHPAVTAWIGWGYKGSGRRATRWAAATGLPCWRLEDGFLRSLALGGEAPPLSLVLDDLGMYYDATRPSRLETLIRRSLAPAEQQRAETLVSRWRSARVSKYNHLREYAGELPPAYVLVVDQTRGDAAIRHGLASPESFHHMLQAALDEHPDCTVLLKIHPEVMAGRKHGHFNLARLAALPRVQVLGEDVHPVRLLEQARCVYTVTSQMGFEALLWGRPVRTFGMPFYAGWGLTEDSLPAPARRTPATLANLVHAALIDYPRYLDPETGACCEVEHLLDWMALQRRLRERFPPQVYAVDFSPWKKPIVRTFLQGSRVTFVEKAAAAPAGATLVVWGNKGETSAAENAGPHTVIRLEDGFLRSVGLGADLVRPLSWVMDRHGIYYDAERASTLEKLLAQRDYDPAALTRARRLRERIVALGLTKYNVGSVVDWRRPAHARRVILVPGQVESDASIRFGAVSGPRTNLDLLQAVRAANPDAHVLYKPHPDVVAGLRQAGSSEAQAGRYCDEVLGDVPMSRLLDQVDEVHTLTSLAGFEALLRGRRVVCHGQPFYSGWGLTEDRQTAPRRGRTRTLDELVAATLIEYPTYVSAATGCFTTPERVLDELQAWRDRGPARLPWWRRTLRLLRRMLGVR